MVTFAIRIATVEDEANVSALLEASYPPLMQSSYDPAVLSAVLPLMTKANPVLLASGTFYLAEIKSKAVVGCGGWTHERPGTGDLEAGLAHIRHFGTHPDWTGQGVGRAIYERCEREARTAGVTCFECYSSLNSEGFYASLGFKVVDRIELRMGADKIIPSVLMKHSLC